MKVEKTKLNDVLIIEPEVFEDFRGEYAEIFNEKEYSAAIKEYTNEEVSFLTECISVSDKNVLRGIHGDDKTWKLISCLSGKFYIVVVNCDETSPEFGKWQSFILSEKNRKQLLIPPKHGNVHLVLSSKAIFQYRQSTYYDPKNLKQFTYRFDDPRFNIWYPIKEPLLSERDS